MVDRASVSGDVELQPFLHDVGPDARTAAAQLFGRYSEAATHGSSPSGQMDGQSEYRPPDADRRCLSQKNTAELSSIAILWGICLGIASLLFGLGQMDRSETTNVSLVKQERLSAILTAVGSMLCFILAVALKRVGNTTCTAVCSDIYSDI